jgi:predicted tellurium resistance membrane protein TerC
LELFGHPVSWRDIILIGGGFFLLYKGTREIHQWLEGDEPHREPGSAATSFGGVIVQIVLLDIVFSLDSVITAVGMANEFWVMATAIVVAVLIMLGASGPVSGFVNRRPTVKMLALRFLLLIGMTLVADGRRLPCTEGVYLRRHWLFCDGRGAEPARGATAAGRAQLSHAKDRRRSETSRIRLV